ncbi:MAG: hypothetical protein Q9165_001026 [Trypethelium subeluteriae]
MEAIEAAASVITLADLIVRTYKAVADLRSRYENAPYEIRHIYDQLKILEAGVLFSEACTSGIPKSQPSLTDTENAAINGAIHVMKKNMIAVIHLCQQNQAKFKGRLGKLRKMSSASGNTLISQRNIWRKEDVTKEKIEICRRIVERSQVFVTHKSARLSPGWKNALGLLAAIARVSGPQLWIYRFYLELSFALFSKKKLLKADLAICVSSPFYESIRLLGGYIGIKNIVSTSSAGVKACLAGNLTLLRELLHRRQISVSDETEDSRPLLWYAASSGSSETVRFLLEKGADASALTGPYHTELLSRAFFHRDVVTSRLLLEYGVGIDHISAIGLVPLFHLYNPNAGEPPEQLLDMLISRGFTNINVQSIVGWTVLHRCASYGSGKDMRRLFSYHADASLRTLELWTPLFCAAHFDNAETLEELLNRQEDPTSGLVDIRGFNPLHVAVAHGSFNVVPLLLKAGLHPHSVTTPSTDFDDVEWRDRSMSTFDIAKLDGYDRLTRYCEVLREAGNDVIINEGDCFWDAETEISGKTTDK